MQFFIKIHTAQYAGVSFYLLKNCHHNILYWLSPKANKLMPFKWYGLFSFRAWESWYHGQALITAVDMVCPVGTLQVIGSLVGQCMFWKVGKQNMNSIFIRITTDRFKGRVQNVLHIYTWYQSHVCMFSTEMKSGVDYIRVTIINLSFILTIICHLPTYSVEDYTTQQ